MRPCRLAPVPALDRASEQKQLWVRRDGAPPPRPDRRATAAWTGRDRWCGAVAGGILRRETKPGARGTRDAGKWKGSRSRAMKVVQSGGAAAYSGVYQYCDVRAAYCKGATTCGAEGVSRRRRRETPCVVRRRQSGTAATTRAPRTVDRAQEEQGTGTTARKHASTRGPDEHAMPRAASTVHVKPPASLRLLACRLSSGRAASPTATLSVACFTSPATQQLVILPLLGAVARGEGVEPWKGRERSASLSSPRPRRGW
ncbi:hypothetical protein RJ55_02819 [Drechmeria coniospora]|nr:hypothetical protein RJ55_02819 [Drechmeria coniospora]